MLTTELSLLALVLNASLPVQGVIGILIIVSIISWAVIFSKLSDKWLRICMFQGAPLPNELKDYDEQWVYKTFT